MTLNVTLTLKFDSPTADVRWNMPAPIIGTEPFPSDCYAPAIVGSVQPLDVTEPRATFLTPGPHTITARRVVDFVGSTGGGNRSASGQGTASITFHRVDADGSSFGPG